MCRSNIKIIINIFVQKKSSVSIILWLKIPKIFSSSKFTNSNTATNFRDKNENSHMKYS